MFLLFYFSTYFMYRGVLLLSFSRGRTSIPMETYSTCDLVYFTEMGVGYTCLLMVARTSIPIETYSTCDLVYFTEMGVGYTCLLMGARTSIPMETYSTCDLVYFT